ncbi:uncharacterized protein LOC130673834 [Microplitis mediator]|uniref:uncharacterized protein LOC130673834 n=1 Tax=Microplitis mediator TaxID=375433 RepID=UPI0025579826|nr:uncharacterized protein LOC130673834 [Microplitis mediator]
MVKYCTVVSCTNSKNNKKVKKELQLQKNSMFTVPKDPEIVRNWSQILEQDLVFSSFICDKHVDEEYILRKDVINIPGQEPYVSERKKITLKPGAIPTLYKNINETSPLINVPVDETVNVRAAVKILLI